MADPSVTSTEQIPTEEQTGEASHFGPHHIELSEWIAMAPFETWLGAEIVYAEEGRAQMRLPFKAELCQGSGFMHGGVLVSLADTTVAMAMTTMSTHG